MMASEITLYDLACTKGLCFSPAVWRIRLMLNYKQIPYRTIFLEFPDIEPTLQKLGLTPPQSGKYTVPAIHHIPTDTYLMDSVPIAQFLELTYPSRPVPLVSPLGQQIESQARGAVGPAFRTSVMPREVNILSPRAQEYFRRTREAALGHALEDLLSGDSEERVWESVERGMLGIDELIRANPEGPFVLGEQPSGTDFFIAGSLQSAKMVDKETFERCVAYPGFRAVYEACLPFMEKRD
ncbi:hypothetical protein N7452_003844 [Penicillium brevicompactum]|uniref:GST N-terminal domain-containing protein n=1 Tax=Penicillium brevicompactum TaxID=5074 RepID=A0A9W9QUE0_PENBR|nr:hypothetical protein N7452_003844 [Penicillium brevicompactum]